jgi:DNA-3-methyladenine glycosylase II
VDVDGEVLHAFPPPSRLADLEGFPGLFGRKTLPGIGDFSAELILLRGAGLPDVLPSHEARLNQAVQRAYDLSQPPATAELTEIAERWRPYRTWVSVLLRTMLEDETHEIARGSRKRT